MIENIVNVSPQIGGHSLPEFKVFVQTQIHSPGAGSPQNVAFRHLWIVKEIGAHGWRSKCVGIVELVRCLICTALLEVAYDQRPAAGAAEVSHGIKRPYGRISWEYCVVTVKTVAVAGVKRRKPGAALGEHLKACLPAPNDRVSPMGKRISEFPAPSYRQIIKPIKNEAMARQPCILAIVNIRFELIVGRPTKAGVALIQACRFLVQVGVRRVEHQPTAVTMLDLGLEGI